MTNDHLVRQRPLGEGPALASANRPRPDRRGRLARRLGAAGLFAAGLLLALPPSCYPARQRLGEDFDTLDGSWSYDLPLSLGRGELAGRDFVFTYGPLYQVVHGLGLVVPPGDLASVLRFHGVPEAVLVTGGVWLTLAATAAPLGWRGGLFLAWSWLWAPSLLAGASPLIRPSNALAGLKPMASLLIVGACARGLARPFRPAMAAAWALAAPALTLYAFDLGLLTLASLALLAAAMAAVATFPARPALRGRSLRYGASALAGASLAVLLLMPWPAGRRDLRDSWAMVRGFRHAMALSFPEDGAAGASMIAGALFLVLVGLVAAVRAGRPRDDDPTAAARWAGLVGMSLFGLLWLSTGLVLSDWVHIQRALVPALFVGACGLPGVLRGQGSRAAAALALTAWWPAAWLGPEASPLALTDVTAYRLTAPTRLEWAPATLDLRNDKLRRAAVALRQRPGNALYVWPFETIYADVAGRRNLCATVQTYAALTDGLERAVIDRLEANPGEPALVVAGSGTIVGIESLSRTPRIVRHLLEHYEQAGPRDPAFLVLRRRPGPPRRWNERPLPVIAGVLRPDDGRPWHLPLPANACRASDLLVLQLRVATGLPALGVKPGELDLTFTLSDGHRRTFRLPVPEDGRPHAVLASACTIRDPLFLSIFHPRRGWRSTERVTSLELRWRPLDRLSRRPSLIRLERLAVLERPDVRLIESSLDAQKAPGLWSWCYAPPPARDARGPPPAPDPR